MILLTGGNGLLGKELQKELDVYAPSHKEMDITKTLPMNHYDLIIHSAAYTDVAEAEIEKGACYNTNVWGTFNLLKTYSETPFVFISTEYAKHPINVYSQTKAIGEKLVEAMARRYLIIRTLFKPRPYPWDKAFVDQYTQGDYLDVIAPRIAKAIKSWNKEDSRLIYVGTGRKTMFDLAKQTRPDVLPNSVDDIEGIKIQKDYL